MLRSEVFAPQLPCRVCFCVTCDNDVSCSECKSLQPRLGDRVLFRTFAVRCSLPQRARTRRPLRRYATGFGLRGRRSQLAQSLIAIMTRRRVLPETFESDHGNKSMRRRSAPHWSLEFDVLGAAWGRIFPLLSPHAVIGVAMKIVASCACSGYCRVHFVRAILPRARIMQNMMQWSAVRKRSVDRRVAIGLLSPLSVTNDHSS